MILHCYVGIADPRLHSIIIRSTCYVLQRAAAARGCCCGGGEGPHDSNNSLLSCICEVVRDSPRTISPRSRKGGGKIDAEANWWNGGGGRDRE